MIVFVTGAILLLQGSLRRSTGPSWYQENMVYLPRGEQLKPALLGFETTVAHYLWIRMVLYFGGHYITDKQYVWLISMLDAITRLCPYFYSAYEFAGLMVPDVCDNPEAARILLERGMTYVEKQKDLLAFQMGMIFYRYYDDRKTAALCFERGAHSKGKHAYKLARLASTFYSQAGIPAEGLQVLMFAWETSDNPDVRRHLAEKINMLQREMAEKRK